METLIRANDEKAQSHPEGAIARRKSGFAVRKFGKLLTKTNQASCCETEKIIDKFPDLKHNTVRVQVTETPGSLLAPHNKTDDLMKR